MTETPIFHICRRDEWQAARAQGAYRGSSQDAADGFIHFSTAEQVAASAAKHRAGQSDLVLLTVDSVRLGPALKWEPARNGQLFPHLYGALPLAAVLRVDDLPLGRDGRHVFPPGIAGDSGVRPVPPPHPGPLRPVRRSNAGLPYPGAPSGATGRRGRDPRQREGEVGGSERAESKGRRR
jgi:uncharacterized protein (DUF952 family)